MKRKNNNTLVIVLSIIAAVFVVGNVGVLWYLKGQIESANFAASKAQIAYEERDIVEGTHQVLEDLASERAAIDAYFVGLDDEVGFITLLEERAQQENVSVTTQNVYITEQETPLPYGDVLEVALQIRGSWNDVMYYIQTLETLPYNVWLMATTLQYMEATTEMVRNEDGEQVEVVGEPGWQANITLRVVKHTK